FVGAVAGELSTPWLMSRLRSKNLLVAGQLVTAVPSLVYLLPHPPLWAMMAAASARGIGMGVAIVVSVALLSDVTAPHRRGASIAMVGFILASCSFGGVITYAPVALPLEGLGSAATFLLVSGATRAASRWLAGILGDRFTARKVLVGGVLVSLAGLLVLATHG